MQSQDNQPMNSLDDSQILAQLPTQTQPEQSPLSDGDILNSLPVDNSQLEETYKKTLDADPDRAAKIIKYQERLNAPLSYIDRNLDRIQKADSAPDTAFWANYEKNFPKSSAFLKDARNMAMAKDDLENLAQTEGLIDNIVSGWSAGMNNASKSEYAWKQMLETLTTGKRSSLNEKEILSYEEQEKNQKAPGEFNPFYFAAQQLPNMLTIGTHAAHRAVQGAGIGATGAATASLFAGPAAPAVAGATVIPAAISGASIGGTVGSLEGAAILEGGGAYRELVNLKNKDGVPVDPKLAAQLAIAVGAINSGMEYFALSKFLKLIPGGDKILSMANKDNPIFKGLTPGKAVMDAAKKYIVAVGAENLTEVTQETSNILAEEYAKKATGGDFEQSPSLKDRYAGIMSATTQATALLGFPGMIVTSATNARDAKQAQANKNFFLALGENVKNSKLLERMPKAKQDFIAAATKDGPVENIYIPVEDFNVHCQKNNIDPKELAGLLGIEKAHDEATKTNDDLVIPTATFGAKLAGTELYNGLADVIKFSRNAFSVKQNKEMSERLAEELKTEYEALKVKFDDKQKLQDGYNLVYNNEIKKMNEAADKTGLDSKQREEFKKNATLFAQYVTVHAAKTGQEVKDVYQGTLNPEYSFGGEYDGRTRAIEEDPFDIAIAAQESAKHEQVKKEFLQNVASEDTILKTIKNMGLSESYHTPEAIKHVRESLAVMLSELQSSKKGERNFNQGEFGGDVEVSANSSTFPQWFRDIGFKTKKEAISFIKNGKSKNFNYVIEKAISRLEDGYKEENHGYDIPNYNFLNSVNPEKAKLIKDKVKFFQNGKKVDSKKDISSYLEKIGKKGSAIFLADSKSTDGKVAIYDPLTKHTIIALELIKNSAQIDDIVRSIESVSEHKLKDYTVNIDGVEGKTSALKISNVLSKRVANLRKLQMCVSG